MDVSGFYLNLWYSIPDCTKKYVVPINSYQLHTSENTNLLLQSTLGGFLIIDYVIISQISECSLNGIYV